MKSSNYRIFFWNQPVQRYWILFEYAGCEFFSSTAEAKRLKQVQVMKSVNSFGWEWFILQILVSSTRWNEVYPSVLYYAWDIVVKTRILFGAEYPQCWYLEHGTANAMINKNTSQIRISPLTAVNFIAKRRTTIQTQRIGTGKNKYNQVIMMLTRHVKKHGHKG